MTASDHTRLVNMFIGLCMRGKRWPQPLRELGYAVQLVERPIAMRPSGRVVPDVIAASNRALHAIVADCKGGKGISPDQDSRYRQLDSGDLADYVTVHDAGRLSHAVCYVAIGHNRPDIWEHTELPLISFDDSYVQARGSLGEGALDKKMRAAIPLRDMIEPTDYYPFSPEDDDLFIIPHVLREMISYFARRAREPRADISGPAMAEEIFRGVHMHQLIGSRHRGAMVGRIGRIIGLLAEGDKDLRDRMSRLRRGDLNASTLDGAKASCKRLLEKYRSQKMLDSFYAGDQ